MIKEGRWCSIEWNNQPKLSGPVLRQPQKSLQMAEEWPPIATNFAK